MIIDYKKKYEEALGWMRAVYPTMTGADKEDAEHYFPELKEGNPGYDEALLNEKIAKASKSWEGVDVDKYMDEVRGR